MYPVLIHNEFFAIYSLGVLWALAAVCAGYIIRLELKRYRLDPDLASSMVFAAAAGGLVGARLLFIIEEWNGFLRAPWNFIFSGAGFSWYGGLIGGLIAVSWWLRWHKIPWHRGADVAAPALALGYGIGRIGCFLAGDATWGKVTDVSWAMAFPNAVAGWVDPLTGLPYPPGAKVHPTQLYEFAISLLVFVVLWTVRSKSYPRGTIFWSYLVLAGSMRFLVEFWRVNPIVAWGLTEYQWFSLAIIVAGLLQILRQSFEFVDYEAAIKR